MNGTCNFILTQMQAEGRAFQEVLAQAQQLGYAEADPTFDVGGFDTAHKLALLTMLAFGSQVALDQIHVEGIEGITSADIEAADELGYRIKLLGVALKTEMTAQRSFRKLISISLDSKPLSTRSRTTRESLRGARARW